MSDRLTKDRRDDLRRKYPRMDGEGIHPLALEAFDECDALERERDALQAHFDAAGDGANLVALLDLYRERQVQVERERDDALEHRNEIDQVDSELQAAMELLCDLLAVIHRDGGQHTAKVGVGQSCADARRIVADSHDLEKDRDQWRKMATEEHWFERAQVAERECASRMKRIYETQREEPSDPLSVERRIRDITLEPFLWEVDE